MAYLEELWMEVIDLPSVGSMTKSSETVER